MAHRITKRVLARTAIGVIGVGLLSVGVVHVVAQVSTGGTSNATIDAKVRFLQHEENARQSALAAPRAPKSGGPATHAGGTPSRQAGILDIRQGPVPASVFSVNNEWQGPVNGSGNTWLVVWAGSELDGGSAPGAPGVIVHQQSPSADGTGFDDRVVGTFTDPAADGPLTITGVQGTLVELQSPSGKSFSFDLASDRFN